MPLPPDLRNCLFTADDWGMSPAINEAILDLARRGIVSRVSILSNGAFLEDGLKDLIALPNVTLGLHFNLSYGTVPAGLMGDASARLLARPATGGTHAQWEYPGTLGRAAAKILGARLTSPRRLNAAVQAHLRQQLGVLDRLGIQIGYVDGHHHVHMLPGVLRAMAPILTQRGIRDVRVPFDPRMLATVRAPLPAMAWPARSSARRLGLNTLRFHYPQLQDMQDGAGWVMDLRRIAARGPTEMIVHPASRDDVDNLEYPDSYGTGRVSEYRALLQLDSNLPAAPPGHSTRASDGT